MSVTARALAVRARVAAAADRAPLADPLALDLLAGGPIPRHRVAVSRRATAGLRDPAAAPLANLDRLARGDAVATVAGQQPAPLGGPLYSLHKTAGAIGLAADVTRRTGAACVPLFWMHGEDSDFAEIRGVSVADAALELHDFQLPDDAHTDGQLVGGIAIGPLRAVGLQAIQAWHGPPGHADVLALWTRSLATARDLGAARSARWLA